MFKFSNFQIFSGSQLLSDFQTFFKLSKDQVLRGVVLVVVVTVAVGVMPGDSGGDRGDLGKFDCRRICDPQHLVSLLICVLMKADKPKI